jgi:hypothetical protein
VNRFKIKLPTPPPKPYGRVDGVTWHCAVFKVHRGAPPGSPGVVSQN